MHLYNKLKIYENKYSILDIIKFELLMWKCKKLYKKYPHFIDEEYMFDNE